MPLKLCKAASPCLEFFLLLESSTESVYFSLKPQRYHFQCLSNLSVPSNFLANTKGIAREKADKLINGGGYKAL